MFLIQCVLIGCVAALSALEGDWLGECKLREPLVTGFLVGLILGDARQGVMIGAELQLIWMGATGIGLSATLDIGTGGTIGTAIAILTGSGPEVAIAFGLPVSILMQFVKTINYTFISSLMHKVDDYARSGDMRSMVRVHYFCGLLSFLIHFIPTFLALYLGKEVIEVVVNNLPAWVSSGLGAVSALLPAVGFAMLLQILMEVRLIPFFIVGFVISAYLHLDMLAITLLAVAMAGVMYMLKTERSETRKEENTL